MVKKVSMVRLSFNLTQPLFAIFHI